VALSASLALVSKNRRAPKRLVIRVPFSDGTVREIVSPFQKPQFAGILASLIDTDGNGTMDSLQITARRGARKVVRTLSL
jgi:hypothetical protein